MSEAETPSNSPKIIRLLFAELPRLKAASPAIFLDRDGVINEKVTDGYVTRWSEFRFLPGVIDVLASLSQLEFPIIVISNQACVEKGLMDTSALTDLTIGFVSRLRRAGARVDAVYYCPHRPETGCSCRKPQAGLLEAAAADWSLDLKRSIVVGDSITDVAAAHSVGARAVLLDPAGALSGELPDTASVRKISDVPVWAHRFLSAACNREHVECVTE